MNLDTCIEYLKNSVTAVFQTMLGIDVEYKTVDPLDSDVSGLDVSGVITLTGDIVGCVVLRFPTTTAVATASALIGTDVDPDSEDFSDAIGELADMVVGGAKAKFEGLNVAISVPSVVTGNNHRIRQPSNCVAGRMRMSSEGGAFAIDIYLKQMGVADKAIASSDSVRKAG